jgi:hypothetical protein
MTSRYIRNILDNHGFFLKLQLILACSISNIRATDNQVDTRQVVLLRGLSLKYRG